MPGPLAIKKLPPRYRKRTYRTYRTYRAYLSYKPLERLLSVEPQFLSVGDEAAGLRLDSFLASHLKEISRTRIHRAIADGDILVNELVAKPSYRLRDRDQIEIDLPEPPPVELVPEAIPLSIIFEDADLVVVNKPAGMIVHPGAGIESGTL